MLKPADIDTVIGRWCAHDQTLLGKSEIETKKAERLVRDVVKTHAWKEPKDANRRDALAYLTACVARSGPGGRKTAKNHLSRLKAFGQFLVDTQELEANPFTAIKLPPTQRRKGASAFSWAEIQRLIARAKEREAESQRAGRFGPMRSTFYTFLALTGLRYSEARRQCWRDVDAQRGMLIVTGDKAKRNDPVQLNAECVELLVKWRKFSRGEKLFPTAPSHHTLTGDMKILGIAGAGDGKRGEWHRFRKGLCTQLRLQSVDAEDRRRMLRHRDAALTIDTYTDGELLPANPALENLPKVNFLKEKSLTRTGGRADTPCAEAMKTHPTTNTVKSRSPAHVAAGLSNSRASIKTSTERGFSNSQNAKGRRAGMEPGGIEPPADRRYGRFVEDLIGVVLDNQIGLLQNLRDSLRHGGSHAGRSLHLGS